MCQLHIQCILHNNIFIKHYFKFTAAQWKTPEFERQFLHIFAIIVYECITKDKVNLIPLWLRIYQSVKIIEEQPNSFSIWQIKLLSSLLSRRINSVDDANLLLSLESMLAIKQKMAVILNKWEHGSY